MKNHLGKSLRLPVRAEAATDSDTSKNPSSSQHVYDRTWTEV